MFSDSKDSSPRPANFQKKKSAVRAVDFTSLASSQTGGLLEESSLEESSFVAEFDRPEQAAEMIDSVELELAKREAFDAGRAAALEEFQEDIDEAAHAVDAAASAALEELLRFREELTEAAHGCVIELSRAMAESVLERELELPEAVISLSRAAVRRACGLDEIHIHVAPSSVDLLENHLTMLREEDPTGDSITVHADANLRRGDIRITSEGGQIEGILAERLDKMIESAFSDISEALNDASLHYVESELDGEVNDV